MKEKFYRVLGKFGVFAKEFIFETFDDFKSVWGIYPNVLIWSGIAFLIALFV